MASAAKELFNTELRLRQLLVPYADKLEQATIYGIPCLRRAGAGAQEWFAFIKPEAKYVSLYLLPLYTSADVRKSLTPALAKRQSGKSVFHFKEMDDAMAAEVEALLARAYEVYMAEGDDKAGAAGDGSPGPEGVSGTPATG
jgi:hypothetical protein